MQVASINASGHKYGELAVVQQAIRLPDMCSVMPGSAFATSQQGSGCLVAMTAPLSVHAFLAAASAQYQQSLKAYITLQVWYTLELAGSYGGTGLVWMRA